MENKRGHTATATNMEHKRGHTATATNMEHKRGHTATATNMENKRGHTATATNMEHKREHTATATNMEHKRGHTATATNMEHKRGHTATATNMEHKRGHTATATNMEHKRGHTATATNMEHKRGHTATATNMEHKRGHTATATNMEHKRGHTATTTNMEHKRGHTATTTDMENKRVHTATATNIENERGHTATATDNKCRNPNTGSCEIEESYGGEADLHEHLNSCEKNPGHQNFVPVDQFSIEHLPSYYRNNDLLDLIRALSDLTVRVSVKYVSEKRPKTWPGSEKPYPCHSGSPRDMLRTGTGWVFCVVKHSKYCRCPGCRLSSSPNIGQAYAEIYIETTAHVVFDELEAQHATCHLFFDRGGTPDSCLGGVTLTDLSVTISNVAQDMCELRCVTYDRDLADRLNNILAQFKSLEKKMCLWYRRIIVRERSLPSCSAPYSRRVLIVIVSHPHGCSKQVSVGYCTSRVMNVQTVYSQLTYTTATCPGSSGAHIFLLGNVSDEHGHAHSGKCDGESQENYSSEAADYFYCDFIEQIHPQTGVSDYTLHGCRLCTDDNVALVLLLLHVEYKMKGPWDVEVSYRGQTELHQRYDTCEKNPGHQKFIPVNEFNEMHLPPSYRDSEVLGLIRATSHLTVRVSVKSVSDSRPKTWPGGEKSDSCYSDSSRNMMMTGSGIVTKVVKYEKSNKNRTSLFKSCLTSPTPETEFAHIHIRTSAQVVYDKFEAEHSTCDFFFDRGLTPDTCPGAVTLSETSGVDCTEKDSREVIYVTDNTQLADRLIEVINRRERLDMILMHKNCKLIGSLPITLAIPQQGPVVIVSHPHGCSKQVSVGLRTGGAHRMTYTTPTCPGCAGAQLLVLENDRRLRPEMGKDSQSRPHIHAGRCEINPSISHGRV